MKSDLKLRIATPGDAGLIFKHLITEMGPENAYFTLSEEKIGRSVAASVGAAMCVLVTEGEDIVAMTGLIKNSPWHSDKFYLGEYFFFVRPAWRKSKAAVLLLDGAKSISKSHGLPLIIGVHTRADVWRKLRFFSRKMVIAGGQFVWGIE